MRLPICDVRNPDTGHFTLRFLLLAHMTLRSLFRALGTVDASTQRFRITIALVFRFTPRLFGIPGIPARMRVVSRGNLAEIAGDLECLSNDAYQKSRNLETRFDPPLELP